jgi:hypothetical protein
MRELDEPAIGTSVIGTVAMIFRRLPPELAFLSTDLNPKESKESNVKD